MEKAENIQGKKYSGYGVCIYCGSDGGSEGLRDEHIIPYSLGGNAEIENASCRGCERKLTPVDAHMARSVYGQFRIHANIQTRNPKDRPGVLPAHFVVRGEEISRELPIKDHPYALALPVWGEPGFMRSARVEEDFPTPYLPKDAEFPGSDSRSDEQQGFHNPVLRPG
jgi:HNH endonuclease